MAAEILSEGAIQDTEESATYAGSTMLTVDLRGTALGLRLPRGAAGDAATLAIARCGEMRVRLLRLARLEAERRAGGHLPGTMTCEIDSRLSGGRLLIDIDVELPLDSIDGGDEDMELAP